MRDDDSKICIAYPKRLTLLDYLKERSYKEGVFTLASGKQSDFYIDCKKTFLDPDGLLIASQELGSLIRAFGVKVVAGEGVGGIPLAIGVSVYMNFCGEIISPVVVRKATKDHGTTARVERAGCVENGSQVVLLEDVLTTGQSRKELEPAEDYW